jgi:hypothetical protein
VHSHLVLGTFSVESHNIMFSHLGISKTYLLTMIIYCWAKDAFTPKC